MAGPQDVAIVRWGSGFSFALEPGGEVALVAGTEVKIGAGTQVIGKVLATEAKVTATVPNTLNNTPVLDIRGYSLFSLWVPPSFDGTNISIWVGHDGINVQPLYDITNAQVLVGSGTVVAGRAYDLPGELAPWPYVLFSCATAQAGGTDFVLVMRTG